MSEVIMTQEMINTFLERLQAEQKSARIIAEYHRNLKNLYTFLPDKTLTRDHLEQWREEQKKQGFAPGTITNRVVQINAFLRFLNREDLCFPNGGRQNLAGKKFGNLLVIEPLQKRSDDRSIYWKCVCSLCGTEKEIPANQLKRGVQISCGCERAERLQKTNGYVDGTCLKNVFSDRISKNNTSGYKGVFRKRGRWAASIQYKKKNYYLGSYDRLEDAVDARKEAEHWVREDAEKLLEKMQETGKTRFQKGSL